MDDIVELSKNGVNIYCSLGWCHCGVSYKSHLIAP